MTTNERTPDPERWLSIEDIAAIIDASPHTLYKWSRRGQPDFPPSTRLPNGRIRVAASDLDAWMRGRGG